MSYLFLLEFDEVIIKLIQAAFPEISSPDQPVLGEFQALGNEPKVRTRAAFLDRTKQYLDEYLSIHC